MAWNRYTICTHLVPKSNFEKKKKFLGQYDQAIFDFERLTFDWIRNVTNLTELKVDLVQPHRVGSLQIREPYPGVIGEEEAPVVCFVAAFDCSQENLRVDVHEQSSVVAELFPGVCSARLVVKVIGDCSQHTLNENPLDEVDLCRKISFPEVFYKPKLLRKGKALETIVVYKAHNLVTTGTAHCLGLTRFAVIALRLEDCFQLFDSVNLRLRLWSLFAIRSGFYFGFIEVERL